MQKKKREEQSSPRVRLQVLAYQIAGGKMKRALALLLSMAMTTGAFAAPQDTSGGTKKTAKKTTTTSTNAKLDQLQKALDTQQQQIQALQQQLQSRDQAIQQMQQRIDQSVAASPALAQAQSKADAAAAQASKASDDVSSLRADVGDIKQNATNTALSLQETQKTMNESPLAIKFKGITITPGGFLAAETVWRQKGTASDINTPFNSIPMPGATQSRMDEFFASGRQSRISMLGEGKVGTVKMSGYLEADFLSAGVTSNNNQSNSYTLRQRQVWGQGAWDNGWTITGGQMWSLITETKKGMDNRTEALPMTIDPQYTVGFSWARQYAFRVTKRVTPKLWLGASVEESQETLTAHGNSQNFVVGAAGTAGGLYNPSATYSYNPAPDFVVKAAWEPGIGHYEVFGVVTDLRDRVFPCATAGTTATCDGVTGPSAAGAFNNGATGAGLGANARVTVHKQFDFGLHFLGGNGIGRYGTAGLADATVRNDGILSPIRSYQALGSIEALLPKIDIYMNGGGEYAEHRWDLSAPGKGVGYGSPYFKNSGCYIETPPGTPTSGQFPTSSNGFLPGSLGSCTGDTRNILEGTLGFWVKLYAGSKGRLQFGPQYSYVTRNTWAGVGGEPHSVENMFFTSFRYYLP
jgi:hypothetical protein